jgi:hypothetical protein
LAILDAIERQDYDVLSRRPAISKARKLWLLARAAVAGIPGTRSASTGAGVGKAL